MGSLDNWFFGEDDTGDLLDKRNADKLVDNAREVLLENSQASIVSLIDR